MRFSSCVAVFVLVFSGSVLSADAIQLDATKDFQNQQNKILRAVNTDVEYSEISVKDRSALSEALGRIGMKLIEGSFSDLSNDDRQKVLAEQKFVNETLVQAKSDSRLVCKREAVLGSNLAKKVCRTSASLKRENDAIRAANSGTDAKSN